MRIAWLMPAPGELSILALKAVVIYLTVIAFTRLAGLRSFSKMSSFDFAMTVAIGSALATVVLTSGISLVTGIFGVGMIYLLQMVVSKMRNYDRVEQVVDNRPILLVEDGEILEENLRKSDVSMNDLRAKLRETNAYSLEEVEVVVFESTGDVSVLHSEDPDAEVADWIMEDVRREV
jgi:uncharacterized membrane protein YcaP (DUF421 family)